MHALCGTRLPKETKELVVLFFSGHIARAWKSGYAFVRQLITGSNGPLGESQWNGPHLLLRKFA
jgi:hypothetical protein